MSSFDPSNPDASADATVATLAQAAAALLTGDEARPCWVWHARGGQLIWANEPGLEALGVDADTLEKVTPTAPALRSLQAVARTQTGAEARGRIEILRISAAGHQETLVATCRAVDLSGTTAVLAMGAAPTARRAASLADEPAPAQVTSPAGPGEPAAVVAPATPVPGFDFQPRSRPHRFSFLVDAKGRVGSLSSGLADAVGSDQAIQDGDVATEALLARVGDLPGAVFHGLDERIRFSEHEVLWPVSGTQLVIPVRLSGFDEGDGALRVFGTALTAKAVALHAEQTAPMDDSSDQAVTPSETVVQEPAVQETVVQETTAQVPGSAALTAAASALTAGFAAGLSRPLAPAHDESEEASAPVAPLEDRLELDEARTAGLWSDAPEPAQESTQEAAEAPADQAAETLADTSSPADVFDTEGDETPEETIKAMRAVAAGLTQTAADRHATPPPEITTPASAEETAQEIAARLSEAESAIDDNLSRPEHLTFQEIARRLGARITGTQSDEATEPSGGADVVSLTSGSSAPTPSHDVQEEAAKPAQTTPADPSGRILPFTGAEPNAERMVLDRLPLGIMVYNEEAILYANRAALDLLGVEHLRALHDVDGPDALFEGTMDTSTVDGQAAMTLLRPDGTRVAVTGRLQSTRWEGQGAVLLSLREHTESDSAAREDAQDASFLAAEQQSAQRTGQEGALPLVRARIGELEAIIDLASDGVVTLDRDGEIKDLNQAAQALVGYSADDLIGRPFRLLFPEDSRETALDYLEDIVGQGRLSLFNEGRELECITAQGGLVPVFMSLGRLTDDEPAVYCAVLRDLSPFKQAETDLVAARKAAEEASAHKSDFLARVSHEIRTPLNAVIGFSEVMLEERFGPVGSERYRQYLRDIHTSGEHLMSLLNDLLDLSKIEAGRMELSFAEVDLNDVVQQCLAIMQPQASQSRIIVRTSLPLTLPKVVADIRSVRQVVLNLMSNAIKFTEAGGQIIVSTLYEPTGEVSLRVRDTGRGMDSNDVALAMEPFRQVPTTLNQVITGTGLGLPLTKALIEANRAQFGLESTPGEGTLAIMTFPSQRVLAE